jgi:hypothetical protein
VPIFLSAFVGVRSRILRRADHGTFLLPAIPTRTAVSVCLVFNSKPQMPRATGVAGEVDAAGRSGGEAIATARTHGTGNRVARHGASPNARGIHSQPLRAGRRRSWDMWRMRRWLRHRWSKACEPRRRGVERRVSSALRYLADEVSKGRAVQEVLADSTTQMRMFADWSPPRRTGHLGPALDEFEHHRKLRTMVWSIWGSLAYP